MTKKPIDLTLERPKAKKINLALQGGGSHGAFTWGVLDRLLEDERIAISAVSGASAGAMNAVVLAEGLVTEGYSGARKCLRQFWEGVANAAVASPLRRSPIEALMGGWRLDSSPFFIWFDMLSRLASPYDLNPLNWNPLRDLLDELIDFEAVRSCEQVKIFVAATDVQTGRPKVFRRNELTADHVMASACLPFIFQAVEIEGRPYWDGGYMGNPPLWPLFEESDSLDLLVVQINPVERPGTPRTAREILSRVNEITFNASLLREFRAIDFVRRLKDGGRLEGTQYRDVLVHMIDSSQLMELGASSKLNSEMAFLEMLFQEGRASASAWLDEHFDSLGHRSSANLRRLFAGEEDGMDGSALKPAKPTS
ncbi:MAG: patatin-like phospholipase family protein [Caulobacterales bacterium]|jgi:NTE family protein